MGMCLVYAKGRETKTDLEYRYGNDPMEMTHRFVIDKTNPFGPLKEGSGDEMCQMALGIVHADRERIHRWPDEGAMQS